MEAAAFTLWHFVNPQSGNLAIARGHCVSLKRKVEPPQTPGCGLGESTGGSVSYLGDCNYSKDFLTQKSNQNYSALNIFLF